MTDFRTLIREGAEASHLMAPGDARDMIARLTTALEETHEVAVGADHTAAKYWRRVVDLERDLTVAQAGAKRAQEDAFAAGWMSSGEGYNGEYPDEGVPWEKSAGREAYERWIEKEVEQ